MHLIEFPFSPKSVGSSTTPFDKITWFINIRKGRLYGTRAALGILNCLNLKAIIIQYIHQASAIYKGSLDPPSIYYCRNHLHLKNHHVCEFSEKMISLAICSFGDLLVLTGIACGSRLLRIIVGVSSLQIRTDYLDGSYWFVGSPRSSPPLFPSILRENLMLLITTIVDIHRVAYPHQSHLRPSRFHSRKSLSHLSIRGNELDRLSMKAPMMQSQFRLPQIW